MNEQPQATGTSEAPSQSGGPSASPDPFVGIATDIVDLGRIWARHGLGIGQQALVSAARTLELSAETLARIAERLRPS